MCVEVKRDSGLLPSGESQGNLSLSARLILEMLLVRSPKLAYNHIIYYQSCIYILHLGESRRNCNGNEN